MQKTIRIRSTLNTFTLTSSAGVLLICDEAFRPNFAPSAVGCFCDHQSQGGFVHRPVQPRRRVDSMPDMVRSGGRTSYGALLESSDIAPDQCVADALAQAAMIHTSTKR